MSATETGGTAKKEGHEGTGPGPDVSVGGIEDKSQGVLVPAHLILATVLWHKRRVLRIRQRALCEQAGITQPTLSRIERGEVQVTAARFFMLDKVLGGLFDDAYVLMHELECAGCTIVDMPNCGAPAYSNVGEVRAIATMVLSSLPNASVVLP